MFSFNEFKLRNIFILIIISIKAIFAGEFIDLLKLSLNDNYFVVLDTGFYLYNFNTFNCSLIHKFECKHNNINDTINLIELYYENKAYIFCLVNEYLFILDEYTYQLFHYIINEIYNFNDGYYNIMPYKIENNNISFIIAFNKDTNKLFLFFYNFYINERINKPKEIIFNDMNIQNKMIRCTMNSNLTFIICFYYSKNNSFNLNLYFNKIN